MILRLPSGLDARWIAAVLAIASPLLALWPAPPPSDQRESSPKPATSQEGAPPAAKRAGLSWLETGSVEFRYPETAFGQRDSVHASTFVVNPGPSAVELKAWLVLRRVDGSYLRSRTVVVAPGRIGVGLYPVHLSTSGASDRYASGYLLLSNGDSTLPARVANVSSPPSCMMHWLLVSTLAIALVVFILVHEKDNSRDRLERRLSSPGWDFSKSWATNITLFGSIVTSLLSLSVLPQQTVYGGRSTYATLALMSTIIVGLGPAVFAMASARNGGEGGTVRAMLFAGLLTLWGAAAQVGLALLLFMELGHGGLLAWPNVITLVTAGALLGVAMVSNAWTSLERIADGANPPSGAGLEAIARTEWSIL